MLPPRPSPHATCKLDRIAHPSISQGDPTGIPTHPMSDRPVASPPSSQYALQQHRRRGRRRQKRKRTHSERHHPPSPHATSPEHPQPPTNIEEFWHWPPLLSLLALPTPSQVQRVAVPPPLLPPSPTLPQPAPPNQYLLHWLAEDARLAASGITPPPPFIPFPHPSHHHLQPPETLPPQHTPAINTLAQSPRPVQPRRDHAAIPITNKKANIPNHPTSAKVILRLPVILYSPRDPNQTHAHCENPHSSYCHDVNRNHHTLVSPRPKSPSVPLAVDTGGIPSPTEPIAISSPCEQAHITTSTSPIPFYSIHPSSSPGLVVQNQSGGEKQVELLVDRDSANGPSRPTKSREILFRLHNPPHQSNLVLHGLLPFPTTDQMPPNHQPSLDHSPPASYAIDFSEDYKQSHVELDELGERIIAARKELEDLLQRHAPLRQLIVQRAEEARRAHDRMSAVLEEEKRIHERLTVIAREKKASRRHSSALSVPGTRSSRRQSLEQSAFVKREPDSYIREMPVTRNRNRRSSERNTQTSVLCGSPAHQGDGSSRAVAKAKRTPCRNELLNPGSSPETPRDATDISVINCSSINPCGDVDLLPSSPNHMNPLMNPIRDLTEHLPAEKSVRPDPTVTSYVDSILSRDLVVNSPTNSFKELTSNMPLRTEVPFRSAQPQTARIQFEGQPTSAAALAQFDGRLAAPSEHSLDIPSPGRTSAIPSNGPSSEYAAEPTCVLKALATRRKKRRKVSESETPPEGLGGQSPSQFRAHLCNFSAGSKLCGELSPQEYLEFPETVDSAPSIDPATSCQVVNSLNFVPKSFSADAPCSEVGVISQLTVLKNVVGPVKIHPDHIVDHNSRCRSDIHQQGFASFRQTVDPDDIEKLGQKQKLHGT